MHRASTRYSKHEPGSRCDSQYGAVQVAYSACDGPRHHAPNHADARETREGTLHCHISVPYEDTGIAPVTRYQRGLQRTQCRGDSAQRPMGAAAMRRYAAPMRWLHFSIPVKQSLVPAIGVSDGPGCTRKNPSHPPCLLLYTTRIYSRSFPDLRVGYSPFRSGRFTCPALAAMARGRYTDSCVRGRGLTAFEEE